MIAALSTVLSPGRSLTLWALFAVFMVVRWYVVAILIAIACFSLVLAWSNSFRLAAGGVTGMAQPASDCRNARIVRGDWRLGICCTIEMHRPKFVHRDACPLRPTRSCLNITGPGRVTTIEPQSPRRRTSETSAAGMAPPFSVPFLPISNCRPIRRQSWTSIRTSIFWLSPAPLKCFFFLLQGHCTLAVNRSRLGNFVTRNTLFELFPNWTGPRTSPNFRIQNGIVSRFRASGGLDRECTHAAFISPAADPVRSL